MSAASALTVGPAEAGTPPSVGPGARLQQVAASVEGKRRVAQAARKYAATIIQTHFRGHLVRRKVRAPALGLTGESKAGGPGQLCSWSVSGRCPAEQLATVGRDPEVGRRRGGQREVLAVRDAGEAAALLPGLALPDPQHHLHHGLGSPLRVLRVAWA